MREVKALLLARQKSLGDAVRQGDRDAVADWLVWHRVGRLLRLEVQNPDRVLAFLAAAEPDRGCLLVLERGSNGWTITETNNSIVFR
jgi:hypothetical protein